MAAAAILKNLKITISRQRFDQSPQNLAWWRNSTFVTLPQLEICIVILKIQDYGEIWHSDAVRPSWLSRPLQSLNFKNPSWRSAILEN